MPPRAASWCKMARVEARAGARWAQPAPAPPPPAAAACPQLPLFTTVRGADMRIFVQALQGARNLLGRGEGDAPVPLPRAWRRHSSCASRVGAAPFRLGLRYMGAYRCGP